MRAFVANREPGVGQWIAYFQTAESRGDPSPVCGQPARHLPNGACQISGLVFGCKAPSDRWFVTGITGARQESLAFRFGTRNRPSSWKGAARPRAFL